MIPLGAGASRVVLTYRPPLWLGALFWAGLAGWAALCGWGATRVIRKAFACAA
jgi:uncharacterized membrane protein YccC